MEETTERCVDFFITELVRRLTDQHHTYGIRARILSEHLQVDPKGTVVVKVTGRTSESLIMAAAIRQLFQDGTSYRIIDAMDVDDFVGTIRPGTVQDVKIGPGKVLECYTEAILRGYEIATGRRFALVVDVEQETPEVHVIVAQRDLDFARDMAKVIHDWVVHNNFLKGQILDAVPGVAVRLSSRPCELTWDDIVLPADLIANVKRNVVLPIKQSASLKHNRIPCKRGVILEGPPGVGKTMLGEVLARDLQGKATFIWVSTLSAVVSHEIANVFAAARNLAPSVIWIEDLDLLAPAREVGWHNSLLGTIMTELDIRTDEPVITVATTNCPDVIEQAVRDRPSRFDRRIQFPLPDSDARLAMLNKFVADIPLDGDVDVDELVTATAGYTGAQMRELVTTTALLAVERDPDDVRLAWTDFLEALEQLKIRRNQLGFTR